MSGEGGKSNVIWWIVGLVAVAVVAGVVGFGVSRPGGFRGNAVTVAEYRERVENKLNGELQNGEHPLRKLVEQAHYSVEVKQAWVSGCKVVTRDGSDIAERGGKNNVRRVDVEISTMWDGKIHKGGKTVLSVTLENIAGKFQATEHKIVKTNALVNL